MKSLFAAAALVCLAAPAAAWDADPASFRRDPQAWVRNVIVPGCKAPSGNLEAPQCDCIVTAIAARLTEADAVRINEPGAGPAISKKANVPYIMLMCYKGLSPN
jgi:hypothetical protein